MRGTSTTALSILPEGLISSNNLKIVSAGDTKLIGSSTSPIIKKSPLPQKSNVNTDLDKRNSITSLHDCIISEEKELENTFSIQTLDDNASSNLPRVFDGIHGANVTDKHDRQQSIVSSNVSQTDSQNDICLNDKDRHDHITSRRARSPFGVEFLNTRGGSPSYPNSRSSSIESLGYLTAHRGRRNSEDTMSISSIMSSVHTSGHPVRKHCQHRSSSAQLLTPNTHGAYIPYPVVRSGSETSFTPAGPSMSMCPPFPGAQVQHQRNYYANHRTKSSDCSGMNPVKEVEKEGDISTSLEQSDIKISTKMKSKVLGHELMVFGPEHTFSQSKSYRVLSSQARSTLPSRRSMSRPGMHANMKDLQDFRCVEDGRLHYRMGLSITATTNQSVLMDARGNPISRLRKTTKFLSMNSTVYVEDIRPSIDGRLTLGRTSVNKQKGVRVLTCQKNATLNLKAGECIDAFFCKESSQSHSLPTLNGTKKIISNMKGIKTVRTPDITIEGDFITPRYVIFNSTRDILARAVPDIVSNSDTYQVQIAPGVDHVLMLNLVMSLQTLSGALDNLGGR